MSTTQNHDPSEIERFEASAQRWWDSEGEHRPLHDINPVRLAYIDERVHLAGKRVLDVGCGGGLAAEGMARRGAVVTGIDLGPTAIEVAQLHALESQLDVLYVCESIEAHAAKHPHSYDVVTCLEMLEHVPDPASIVQSIAALIKPGGHAVLSTFNRNPKSYLLGVLAAEYALNLVPKGTHSYTKFIRPSELARWLRIAGLSVVDLVGLEFNPFTRQAKITADVAVNYLMQVEKRL
jgi:2-polyprenyl-6-hydroxyphenyl methylase/3-demethylubiquinone-9 3-methyltransferase